MSIDFVAPVRILVHRMSSPDTDTAATAPSPVTFADLGLDSRILEAVERLGFDTPTDIQKAALPPLLDGRDVIGRARTGSGKTAAFGLPLLHRLAASDRKGHRALVLAPTRELAQQVAVALNDYGRGLGLSTVTVTGGASYRPQLKALKQGVPIVVGTPGRLLDHLASGALDLSTIEFVVLDEADEMLRMGFVEDVETMLGAVPEERQIALFSATMPAPIARIAKTHLRDPLTLQMTDGGPAIDHIQQAWCRVPTRNKPDALRRAILGGDRGTTLVFARTRASCGDVAGFLDGLGVRVEALHGDMSQPAREQVLRRLRAARVEVVVATDIAARGIDVDHITQVVNLDLPENSEVYVHRIGRTGRAGRAGRALTFVTPAEIRKFTFWQRKRLNEEIPEVQLPSDRELARRAREALGTELSEASTRGAGDWLAELTKESEVEEVALAALSLLARSRRVPLALDELDDQLPAWAKPRPPRSKGPRPPQQRFGGPRDDGPPPRDTHPDADPNHVELFFAMGRQAGLRAGDLVGALANEAGIPGGAIGKITISDRKSFVGLPKDLARAVLERTPQIELRGRQVRVSPSKGRHGLPDKRGKARPHRSGKPRPAGKGKGWTKGPKKR